MDSNPSNSRHLYIYCHPFFNAFFIYDIIAGEWIVSSYESNYEANEIEIGSLKTWLSRNMAIFNTRFDNVIVAIDSDLQVLVPKSFNEEQKSAAIQDFSTIKGANSLITFTQDLVNEAIVYQFNKEIFEVINSHFDNCSLIHGDTGLIRFSEKKENEIIAQIFGNHLSIAYSDTEKLQYYNRFECKHPNDFLYFILLAYKTAGLNPQQDKLLIGGLIEAASPLYEEIRNYIEHVEILEQTVTGKFDFAKHYFFNILNLPL